MFYRLYGGSTVMSRETYRIAFNRNKRTYTIRKYRNGKLAAKFRSHPQSEEDYKETWTEREIRHYLRTRTSDYETVGIYVK